jgi:hypothetical protein
LDTGKKRENMKDHMRCTTYIQKCSISSERNSRQKEQREARERWRAMISDVSYNLKKSITKQKSRLKRLAE